MLTCLPHSHALVPLTLVYLQVLAIVYGGNSTQPGAFYPKGLTGAINGTVAAS